MIRYALKCAADHSFESWFKSADAYEKLHRARMVACPVCGGTDVTKTLMAPGVQPGRGATHGSETPAERPLSGGTPDTAEQALAELKRNIEENADYVGMNFATEARAIHDGGAPQRSIYGEAKPEDARQLIEDGVPVAPLPFLPNRKTN